MVHLRKVAAALTIFTAMSFFIISFLPNNSLAALCSASCVRGGVTCSKGTRCIATDLVGCTSWDANGRVVETKTCSGNGGDSDPPGTVE